MLIRNASLNDAAIIVEYNAAMACETEGITLNPDRLRPGVEAVLTDRAKGLYFIAEREGRVVGQSMITYEWSDWRNGFWWWIQSVYVHPDFRTQGVFRALYGEIEARARQEKNVVGLRLYVERENHKAQSAYRRMGMSASSYQMYEAEF